MRDQQKTTHFGFESVDVSEKVNKVGAVFRSVAKSYDIMNDLMSFGVHRLWKHFAIEISAARNGQTILDLAGGTGDLAYLLSKRVGREGHIYLADINEAMLAVGRDRLIDAGVCDNVNFIQANAECLPFANNSFDCVTMAFGLRNVTDKQQALASIFRVCKPGGKIMILEFSAPTSAGIKAFYDWYSFKVLPKMGKLVANDADSYRYLAESIRMHPNQEQLAAMIEGAGFEDCSYHNLTSGIVALHIAYKY